MPKVALSDLKIRALKSDRQQDFWDTKTPGFDIRVSPRSKTFIANRGGTRKTLGHYPAISLTPCRRIPRERLLSNDELKAIWRAADRMGDYGRHVQLLITTGHRCNQILLLEDEWLTNDTITFPAPAMKGNRTHIIPLGKLTASLVKDRSRLPRFQNLKKAELDRLSGVSGWTLHDIRRAFASGMASLGVSLPVIERLLAHRSGSFAGIVGVYQRYNFLPEMRAAIELWETHLAALIAVPRK